MGCGASKSKPSAAEGLPLVVDKAAAEPEPKLFTALSSTSPWNTVKVDSVPTSVRSRKLSNPEPTDAALNPPAPPEEASSDSDASDAEGDGNFMMQQYTTSEDEDDSDDDDDGGDGDGGNDEQKEGEGDGSFMMQQYSSSSSANSSDEEQDTTTEEEEEEAPLTIGDRVDDALAPDYTGAHLGRLLAGLGCVFTPLRLLCSQTFRR